MNVDKININYTPEKDELSKKYNQSSGRIMIVPTANLDALERLWDKYNSQHKQLKREADWKSLEIFGINNQDHYEYLKAKYSKYQKIDLPKPENILIPSDNCTDTNLIEFANIRSNDIEDIDIIKISENTILNKKDLEINLNKFENGSGNVLLITGLSGSGKSTLASQLSSKYDCVYYELDALSWYLGKKLTKEDAIGNEDGLVAFIDKKRINPNKSFSNKEKYSIYKEYIKFLIHWCKKQNDKKFIIEGLQIYETYEKGDTYITSCPIIIKGTSGLSSAFRAAKRNSSESNNTTFFKEFKPLVLWALQDSKKLNYFKKSLNESEVSSNLKLEMSSFDYGCLLLENNHGIKRDLSKLNLSLYETKNIYESLKKEKILTSEDPEENGDGFTSNVRKLDYPALPPDELLDLGVFSNDNYYAEYKALRIGNDYTSKNWFESYQKYCMGVVDENTSPISIARHEKLIELCYELSNDPKNNQLKQWILELGWNPEIPYTANNRQLVSKSTRNKLNKFYNEFSFIDIQGIENIDYLDEAINEDKELYPVYIVILSSSTNFGKLIKKATNSIWTHGAVSFDTKMDRIYSYDREGFTYDSFDKYGKDAKVSIYTVFLNKRDYIKIKTRLDYYIANKKRTHYGTANLLNVVMGKVKNHDLRLICTEFVDKLFKYVGIDITHKSSNLVTPEDVSKSAKNNKKIYLVYEGFIGNYNRKKVDKVIEKLKATGVVFKELFTNKLCDRIIDKYTIEPIVETKEFPVQFDKEGNLLIKNIKKINYNEEYNKSHRLLKEYEKAGNIEGMKYEISKLWFMLNVLEKIKHEKKLSKEELKKINDSRARINNDFQKYLSIIHYKDKSFNFNEYYESTPFSDSAYKFNASTLKFTKDFIKSLII